MRGVHRRRDRRFSPWKNGGGETAEILASPPGAGLDGFDWRLSTAIVAADGPFSVFPGVDRVLTLIEGGTMLLTVDGSSQRLTPDSAPFAFAGDTPCSALVEGGPILDFNVMVRRPLRVRVTRGPLAVPAGRLRFLLLMDDACGLQRLDLVDADAADPALVAALTGVPALMVAID